LRALSLALAFIIALAPPAEAAVKADAKKAVAPSSTDIVLGNPKAKVRVEEYASLSCTHCARFNNEVFPAFKAKYIDTGKVAYVLHEFITPPEQLAVAGFLLARCVAPSKYYSVIDDLFHRQARIYETHDLKDSIMAAGKTVGLTEEAVRACLQNQQALDALNKRVEAGLDAGVSATPTFLFNGVRAMEGEMTLEQLDSAYDAALKRKFKVSK